MELHLSKSKKHAKLGINQGTRRFFLLLLSLFSISVVVGSFHPVKLEFYAKHKSNFSVVHKLGSIKFRDLNEFDKVFLEHTLDSIFPYDFNGAVLVAKDNAILYERYKGIADLDHLSPIGINTPFQLASVSKTFTGMAIMKLYQDGLLFLDEKVAAYFPEFPYADITIRMLLQHRSGLPNYIRAMRNYNHIFYSNQDVLDFFRFRKPLLNFKPNSRFTYCNTNYVLLALLIEKVSGKSYETYLQNEFFTPYQMSDTYVFSEKYKDIYTPSYSRFYRKYKLNSFDFIYGDKNIYSTARDMMRWNQLLTDTTVFTRATLQEAYEPGINVNSKGKGYGCGWRVIETEDRSNDVIYHNGWWHGNRTVFTRLPTSNIVVIGLTNNDSHRVYQIKKIARFLQQSLEETEEDSSEAVAE